MMNSPLTTEMTPPGSRAASPIDASPILSVKDLSLGLQTSGGFLEALSALEFCIEAGQTFALVGESGCGKSMTA
jgi:ABC-type glutathione transport system ATPase component